MTMPVSAEVAEVHAPVVIDAVWRTVEHHGRTYPVPLPPLDPDIDKVWIILAPPPRLDPPTERTH